MIKLIVSDMDGTLLDDHKKIDPQLFQLLPILKEKGIRFVVASGRQYPSLQKDFKEHIEDVVVIAENGAFVMDHKKELLAVYMTKAAVDHCLDVILPLEGAEPLVCTRYCSYTSSQEVFELLSSPRFNYAMKLVDNLYEIQEDIIKVSVIEHGGNGAEACFDRLRPVLDESLTLVVSGDTCLDTGIKGVNKGHALGILQEMWGILPEETMVFGDQYNDAEMLQKGEYSFAMAGASPGVKALAKFQAGSNNEGGVCKAIGQMLNL